jgi:hypothetical protein
MPAKMPAVEAGAAAGALCGERGSCGREEEDGREEGAAAPLEVLRALPLVAGDDRVAFVLWWRLCRLWPAVILCRSRKGRRGVLIFFPFCDSFLSLRCEKYCKRLPSSNNVASASIILPFTCCCVGHILRLHTHKVIVCACVRLLKKRAAAECVSSWAR